MKFLFWNLGRRDIVPLVAALVEEHDLEAVVLAECNLPPAAVVATLNAVARAPFTAAAGIQVGLQTHFRLPSRSVRPIRDTPHISVRAVQPMLGPEFLVFAMHLQSKLFQEAQEQAIESSRLRTLIEETEDAAGHTRSIVVGDLNMNPFENGVVAGDGLHAVRSRRVAQRGARKVNRESRRFFYNPMWRHFGGQHPEPEGTYFKWQSRQVTHFWNIFDQVLVRPSLLDYFDDAGLRILSAAGKFNLLSTAGRPDPRVGSDHLPILFDLQIERAVTLVC